MAALLGLKKRPRTTATTVILIVGLTIGGIQWWRWWQSHKPREISHNVLRQVEVTLSQQPTAPAAGAKDQGLMPLPLKISFSGAPAAPLEAIGKEAGDAVRMTPHHPGKWTWQDGSTLVFQPENHWPPAIKMTATLNPSALAKDIELDTTRIEISTPPLGARLVDFNFYNSPKDPTVYQVVGELQLTHPVDVDVLRRQLRMEVVGGTDLFTPGQPLFTVDPDPDSSRRFYIRSRQIVIPQDDDWVKLIAPEGIPSTLGGQALTTTVEAKTRVPDKYSGLKIVKSSTRIIRTADGTPQQFLFVETNRVIDSREISGRIGMWWHQKSWRHRDKSRFNELIGSATPVKLTLVEGSAAVSTQHAFRFLEPRTNGQLLMRIEKGVQSPGGFEIDTLYETTPSIPAFPKETRILGKGNILSLDGERRLAVQSRGVDHLRVTLCRVPDSQFQHLVAMSGHSNFDNPSFSGDFSENNIIHRWSKVIRVPRVNDWDANHSVIDIAEAPPILEPESLPGGRGVFFVTVEPVSKMTDRPAQDDIYSRIDWPSWGNPGGEPHVVWYRYSDNQPGDGWARAAGNSSERFLMVTDLGLLVKAAADGSRDVFVMSLSEGKPLPGVVVQALARNGTAVESVTTDDEGHARLADFKGLSGERLPVAVVASKDGDISFLPFNERQLPAMDYSRFDIDGVLASRIKEVEAFIFTERGVYRPGDTVHTGVITRRRDWQPVLEGLPLLVTLDDSRGRSVASLRTRLPYDGFFACDLPLTEASPLGVYQLEVHVLNSHGNRMFRLGRSAIRVEEFQPDTMKLSTSLSPAPPVGWMDSRDTEAVVTVKSLFGEAAAERRVTMKLELSPARFSFPEWPGYTFHDQSGENSHSVAGRTIDLGETKTAEDGTATFKMPLGNIKNASYRVSILSEAFERNGGRSVTHAMNQLVSPNDQVIGWKVDGSLDTIAKDGGRELQLVAVGRDLKAVKVDNLRRRIIEIRQVSALTQLNNGNYAYVSTTKRSQLSEQALTLDAAVSSYPLPTAKAGRFIMEIVDLDGVTLCAVPFRIVGKADPNIALEREAELDLQLSLQEALPGEEIEVHLAAPYAGAGLVTIERDQVIASQWFKTDAKATTVKLRIPADAEGTYYINAAYIRGTSQPEIFHSPLSYAAAPLRVLAPQKQLKLSLEAPREVRPGTVARFKISADRPSKVVVYAVDEGIHRITNYQRPRPLDFFLRKQALEVRTQQWLDLLLPEYRFLRHSAAFGGDGEGEMGLSLHLNPFKRRKEPPVVYWSGMVETGPDGHELSWDVPDYFNGNLRVMAVGCQAGALGSAEADTLVKAPIILQPNTPLFVSPGDEFEVSLAVFNHLETPGASDIRITANSSPQLEAIGASSASLTLEQGRESDVRFRFRARDLLGAAELSFEASGSGESVRRGTSLSIRPATHHLTRVVTGWFRIGSTEEQVKRKLYPQFRHTEATASVTPLGIARGLEAYISQYPYGCTEQITSKAMVKLVASTETDFGIDADEASKAVRHAINLLSGRQRADGGFGYWYSGQDAAFEFHALYVLHFLTEASMLGHPVPEALLRGALRYAARTAHEKPGNLRDAEMQAYAIYLLARNGAKAGPQLLNLRDTLESGKFKGAWLHTTTAAWMAASYKLLKDDKEANSLMAACVKARAEAGAQEASSEYHRTPQIDALKVFYLRCRHFPEQAKSFGIDDLEPVMKPLRDQSFNTLACSYMTLALKSYADLAAATGLEVSLHRITAKETQPSLLAGPSSGIIRATFDADTTAIRYQRHQQGDGDIGAFYQLVEQGYDAGPAPGPLRSGLEVSREINPVKKDQPLRPGDPVEVVLRVRNVCGRDLDNLAVVDLLPAGFEVVAGDLKSGARTVPGSKFAELREDRNLFFITLDANQEWSVHYRMKAVCAGSFAVPTAMAEDMYDRGLHGVSKPGRIEIAPAK